MMPKLKVSRQGHGPWFKWHVVFHWIMSGFSEASVDLLCLYLYTFPLGDIDYGLLNFIKCRVFFPFRSITRVSQVSQVGTLVVVFAGSFNRYLSR